MTSESWHYPKAALLQKPAFKLERKRDKTRSSVTIGVTSFKRPHELRRCVSSIIAQTHDDISLIISNDDVDFKVMTILSDCDFGRLEEVIVYDQPVNLGLLGNCKFLLDVARTDYFMWLADDDEITKTYVRDLLLLLASNSHAAGAMGSWSVNVAEDVLLNITQYKNSLDSDFLRIVKYVWKSDDAFFYGLFRRRLLQSGEFLGYCRPNEGVVGNWCYVFLMYVVLQGPILYTETCSWIKHDDVVKLYPATPVINKLWLRGMAGIARRANLYILYVIAAARIRPSYAPVVGFASVFAFLRDCLIYICRLMLTK